MLYLYAYKCICYISIYLFTYLFVTIKDKGEMSYRDIEEAQEGLDEAKGRG